MKQATSMLWKEWHELRVYLFIGLGVLVGFPMIEALERFHFARRVEFTTSPWVIMLGGVLAVFVGVGAGCRDFNGRLEDFWRSRPVGPARWMLVKYAVGLFVVLVSCTTPLALELWFHKRDSYAFNLDTGTLLAWSPFLWAALFSIAFLAGCLIQRTAQASMLALAAMLLVYCLPLVLPPLEWLNVGKVMDADGAWGWEQVRFGAGMVGLAGASLMLALAAVRYDWRIESGRKMMYGSVSVALLILVASAAYQVGTNLPILQEINLPAGEQVELIRCDGRTGFVVTGFLSRNNSSQWFWNYKVRKLQLTTSGIELGDAISTNLDPLIFTYSTAASTSQHPEIAYCVTVPVEGEVRLNVADFYTDQEKSLPGPWAYYGRASSWVFPFAWHDRLFLFGERQLATYDITKPMAPRLISVKLSDYNMSPIAGTRSLDAFIQSITSEDALVRIPQLPDVPLRERLIAAVKWGHIEGDFLLWPYSEEGGIAAYHLDKITDNLARFKKIGESNPSLLERFLTSRDINRLEGENGLVYISPDFRGGAANPNITVLDINSRPPLRPVGHFAGPGVDAVCPLPDGRAIIGGTKLWLVGPPPRHSN